MRARASSAYNIGSNLHAHKNTGGCPKTRDRRPKISPAARKAERKHVHTSVHTCLFQQPACRWSGSYLPYAAVGTGRWHRFRYLLTSSQQQPGHHYSNTPTPRLASTPLQVACAMPPPPESTRSRCMKLKYCAKKKRDQPWPPGP